MVDETDAGATASCTNTYRESAVRTTFFKRNRVRKRRVVIATTSVVAAITAATVFLCIRPGVVAHAAALSTVNVAQAADQTERRAEVAATAMASGALVTLADRHASDAERMADASDDDLGWDYVQLRL
jgi:predicted solute-binding protein